MNPICLIVAAIGLSGSLQLIKNQIALHAMITTSIFGSFLFF